MLVEVIVNTENTVFELTYRLNTVISTMASKITLYCIHYTTTIVGLRTFEGAKTLCFVSH